MCIRDRYRLCTAGESFKCIGVSATVQNMIPLTEQVAIQGNATFTQFNNTMYALGFNDTMYDTPYNYLTSADYPLQYPLLPLLPTHRSY